MGLEQVPYGSIPAGAQTRQHHGRVNRPLVRRHIRDVGLETPEDEQLLHHARSLEPLGLSENRLPENALSHVAWVDETRPCGTMSRGAHVLRLRRCRSLEIGLRPLQQLLAFVVRRSGRTPG